MPFRTSCETYMYDISYLMGDLYVCHFVPHERIFW